MGVNSPEWQPGRDLTDPVAQCLESTQFTESRMEPGYGGVHVPVARRGETKLEFQSASYSSPVKARGAPGQNAGADDGKFEAEASPDSRECAQFCSMKVAPSCRARNLTDPVSTSLLMDSVDFSDDELEEMDSINMQSPCQPAKFERDVELMSPPRFQMYSR